LSATDPANWFAQDYPGDGEIERLSAQADQIDVVKQSLDQIRSAQTGLERVIVLRRDRAREAAEKLEAVPTEWQLVCPSLTVDQVVAWKREAKALSGADARYQELVRARDEQAGRERRLEQIALELTQIPDEARCPVECLEEQERLEEQRFKAAHDEQQKATSSRQELLDRSKRRVDLAAKHLEAGRQARLYGILAQLLGRDYLQRHLLQRAEMAIVYYANQTLDRISGGALRMALRQSETAEEQSAGKSAAKALDLVAYKKDVGNAPLLVGALSGSQRFRVAVSLALGIGEYAGQGARRNQSVIIDEGFGSLDQQGRHDMIQELHALKSVLRRIIVVSHQEEFFNAFSRGYKIELVDGTSRVSDLDVAAVGGLAVELAEPVLSGMAV
jgi:DNA repair exonuclease SbcCD ATPase subunit